jgi:hypothetical protein
MINNILLIVAVFNIILSIIIIILSTVRKRKSDGSIYLERNHPGIYSGIIIMIFSFSFLLLLLLGKISVEDYSDIAFWGIGGMFFVCGVVLLIGFININQVEMFSVGNLNTDNKEGTGDLKGRAGGIGGMNDLKGRAGGIGGMDDLKGRAGGIGGIDDLNERTGGMGETSDLTGRASGMGEGNNNMNPVSPNSNGNGIPNGICQKDGIYGTLMSNGVCVIPAERLDNCKENAIDAYKAEQRAKAEREKVKRCRRNDKEDFKEVSRGDIDGNKVKSNVVNKELGICEFKNQFGNREFGYMHPYFGRKCMTAEQLTNLLNKYPDQKKIHNVKGNIYYHPYQSTKCLGYPINDLVSYDLICKENFGNNYGVKKIDGENCPENDYRAYCENGYQAGVKLEAGSTKCVPVGSDMNVVCQNKNLRENTSNYMRFGYKDIKYDGCPDGYQRGVCDGNYYDGTQLFENTTSCFPETNNPDRMCKKEFGILSFSEKIIADNCKIGNIRAKCANTNSQKN